MPLWFCSEQIHTMTIEKTQPMTEMVDVTFVLVAGAICAALAVGAWRAHILDEGGAISAFLIGFVTFTVPAEGWKWFVRASGLPFGFELHDTLQVSGKTEERIRTRERRRTWLGECHRERRRRWTAGAADSLLFGRNGNLGCVSRRRSDGKRRHISHGDRTPEPKRPQIDYGLEEDRSRWHIWRHLPLWRACRVVRSLDCRCCCWTFGNDR